MPENQPSWRPNNFCKNKQIIKIQKQTNTVGARLHKFITKYLNFLCSWSNKSMFAPFLKRSIGIVGTEKTAFLSWMIVNSRFDNKGFIRLNCTLFFLSLVWLKLQTVFTARKRGHSLESDTILHVSKVKIALRSQYKNFENSLACSFVVFVYFIFQVFFLGRKLREKLHYV